jgi:branched-chain amino acid transport system ATP-binding protein
LGGSDTTDKKAATDFGAYFEMTELLSLSGVNKRFGGLHVTRDISLTVAQGERVALIGPNGAGKTTLVNLISGVLTADTGTMTVAGKDVTHLNQAKRVNAGLARTFQITTLAQNMTALEQVEMAIFERENLAWSFWHAATSRKDYARITEEAVALLNSIGLEGKAQTLTQHLAYGDQRLIEIALALALQPKVLLLDEPMAGVPQSEGLKLLDSINALPTDIGIILIEHDMGLVFKYASRIIVLADGAVLADGRPEQIKANPAVRAAYLGTTHD